MLVSRSPASRECGCRPKLNTHQPDTAFSKQHSPFTGKGGEVIATLRHGFCRNDALARSDSRVSATRRWDGKRGRTSKSPFNAHAGPLHTPSIETPGQRLR
jgi:hypothetical protein